MRPGRDEFHAGVDRRLKQRIVGACREVGVCRRRTDQNEGGCAENSPSHVTKVVRAALADHYAFCAIQREVRLRLREQVARILNAVFEIGTAITFLCVAIAFYSSAGESLIRSPVGQTAAPYDYVWNGFYVLGAAGILFGLPTDRRALELAGLVALGWGLVANAIAVAVLNPDPRIGAYVALASCCAVRIALIVRR